MFFTQHKKTLLLSLFLILPTATHSMKRDNATLSCQNVSSDDDYVALKELLDPLYKLASYAYAPLSEPYSRIEHEVKLDMKAELKTKQIEGYSAISATIIQDIPFKEKKELIKNVRIWPCPTDKDQKLIFLDRSKRAFSNKCCLLNIITATQLPRELTYFISFIIFTTEESLEPAHRVL